MLKNKLWLSLFSSCPGRGTATKSCKVASWMMEFRWRSASSQCKLMTWPTYKPESFRDSQFKKSQDIWRCFNGRSNSTDTFQYWVATFPQKRKKKQGISNHRKFHLDESFTNLDFSLRKTRPHYLFWPQKSVDVVSSWDIKVFCMALGTKASCIHDLGWKGLGPG